MIPEERPITKYKAKVRADVKPVCEKPKGGILVLSNDQKVNEVYGLLLSRKGYDVYTGITYTDINAIYQTYAPSGLEAIVFAHETVHSHHHDEGEQRPTHFPEEPDAKYDPRWKARNMKKVVDDIRQRQEKPVVVFAPIAGFTGRYGITTEILTELHVDFPICKYATARPEQIVQVLEMFL